MTLFGISGLLVGTTSFVMGVLVYFSGRNKKFNKIWIGVTFGAGTWGYGSFIATRISDYATAMLWWKTAYLGVIFAAICFFHFVCVFLKYDRRIIIKLAYGLGIIFSIVNLFHGKLFLGGINFILGLYWFGPPGWVYNVFYVLIYICLHAYSYYLLFKKLRTSFGQERTQIIYFIVGSSIAWIGSEGCFPIGWGIKLYPASNFLVALYPIILGYAIIKHQLLDIEVIVKKTFVFAGLLASVFAMLILPTLLIQEYVLRRASSGGRLIGLTISGIIIILTMRKIESFLINITDKYLFQKKYDYKELLKTFTAEVLTVLELDSLVNLTVDKLVDIVKLQSSAVLLFDDEKQQFDVVASHNIKDSSVTLIRPDGIVTFMDETHGYILMKELHKKDITIPASIREIMDKLNAELIIPMVLHEEVIGILSLGKKKSDEEYTQDDLDILLPLARTLAIAISNAQLFVELGQTQAEAAQKEKMAVIGTLSAGINHEICNPLGIARGQCEAFLLNIKDGLYNDKSSDELLGKAKEIMKKVIKETDRATAITKKLSGFAKPSKGEAEMVNIEKEVDEVMTLVGYELKLEKIELEKNIGSELPDIYVDKKQFQEVLFNLIRNAGQAIGEKGRITVTAKQDGSKILIDIKDTGSGIPEDKVNMLFNPFFTTKDPGKGTGLGLFIVRQVVEKNGGRIRLKETKVGQGTTFELEFPVGTAEMVEAKKQESVR